MEPVEALMQFGLTRQESTLYITLLTEGDLTGYEASKLTGISRSNAYNALAGLVEKGAAYVVEGNVTQYTPVKIDDFCANKLRSLDQARKALAASIPERKLKSDGYITIRGRKHILDKIKSILQQTRKRVYLSASLSTLQLLTPELLSLLERGVKVVVITNQPPNLDGAILYLTQKKDWQIRLISDSQYVLTGEIADDASTCLYSGKKNLADVFKEALGNEIQLLNIQKREKGE